MFDCVLPTRLARHGTALTSAGRYQVRAARHAADDRPARPRLPLPGVRPLQPGLPAPPARGRASRPGAGCSPSTTWPGCSALVGRARDAIRTGTLAAAADRGGCHLGTRGRCAKVSRSLPRGGAPDPSMHLALAHPRRHHAPRRFGQAQVVELDVARCCSSSSIFFVACTSCFIRPRQQRHRRSRPQARAAVGRRRRWSAPAGSTGEVVALDADVAEVEVAPGVVLTFLRRAINPGPTTAGRPAPRRPAPSQRTEPGEPTRHSAEDDCEAHDSDGPGRLGNGQTVRSRPRPAILTMRRGLVWSLVFFIGVVGRSPWRRPSRPATARCSGLDLRGGVSVVLQPQGTASDATLQEAVIDHRPPGQRPRRRQLECGPPGQRRGHQPAGHQGRPGAPSRSRRDRHPVLPARVTARSRPTPRRRPPTPTTATPTGQPAARRRPPCPRLGPGPTIRLTRPACRRPDRPTDHRRPTADSRDHRARHRAHRGDAGAAPARPRRPTAGPTARLPRLVQLGRAAHHPRGRPTPAELLRHPALLRQLASATSSGPADMSGNGVSNTCVVASPRPASTRCSSTSPARARPSSTRSRRSATRTTSRTRATRPTRAWRPSSSTAVVESAPAIQAPSFNGTAVISGSTAAPFTSSRPTNLAVQLKYGSLPGALHPAVRADGVRHHRQGLPPGRAAGRHRRDHPGAALHDLLLPGPRPDRGAAAWPSAGALLYSIITELSQTRGLALTLAGVTGHHRVDRHHRRLLRGVLRAAQRRGPRRPNHPPVGRPQLRPGVPHRADRRLRGLPGRRRSSTCSRWATSGGSPSCSGLSTLLDVVHGLLLHPPRGDPGRAGTGPSPTPASSASSRGLGARDTGGGGLRWPPAGTTPSSGCSGARPPTTSSAGGSGGSPSPASSSSSG